MCLQEDKHDRLLWKHGKAGLFSVCRSKEILENKKKCTRLWLDQNGLESWSTFENSGFSLVGHSRAIATKSFLLKRGVISGRRQINCLWCTEEDDSKHILIHCFWAWKVWGKLLEWWGFSWVCLNQLKKHWEFVIAGKVRRWGKCGVVL